MRLPVACISALTVCLSPPAAFAQSINDTKKFNEPASGTGCISQVAGTRVGPYPYSVNAIRRALSINDKDRIDPANINDGPRIDQVNVLVVDNKFYGYRVNDGGAGPPRVSSKNFSSEFFLSDGDDFAPWINEDDVSAERTPPQAPNTGHGTHVVGIVLGGMYDAPAPDENSNLRSPNVRQLLLYGANGNKPWLEISFLNVAYGTDDGSEDPIGKLKKLESALVHWEIVNMSLGKTVINSLAAEQLPRDAAGPLIVTSAGNSGKELGVDVQAVPAILDDNSGRMLVVASHDADGRLSDFSNYGKHVNIAAPGCQIKSWAHGEEEARPLNGTSMATAIVTFGAALVRSRWGKKGVTSAIRNRMLASARYVPDLQECSKLMSDDQRDVDSHCVKDGAMLDIETAVLLNRDFIEFQDCAPAPGQDCVTKVAVGDLVEVPSSITRCIGNNAIQDKPKYQGFSYNGAIKRMDNDRVLVAYESGASIGSMPLATKVCSPPDADAAEILFSTFGAQLDGSDVQRAEEPEQIRLSKLTRLVTRVRKPN